MDAFRVFRQRKRIEFKVDNASTHDGAIDLKIKLVHVPNAVVSHIRFEPE